MSAEYDQGMMERRLVRYADLKPCTTAFIDTRTPGSEQKENFTIIGPGVAENPDQFVHIATKHGFNIGGARQPPRCVNSQHSHETAEVFLVHSGRWRFKTGERGTDGHVDLAPGDVISIPTRTFRGFENIGSELGFMFAVLGGDDPGRVMWAPYVFEEARAHGLVLLENGRLIDTQVESVPTGARVMPATTAADVGRLTRYNSEAIERCVVRSDQLVSGGGVTHAPSVTESPVVGVANPAEAMPAARMSWPHGFQVRVLQIGSGAGIPEHVRAEEEVLMMHEGTLSFEWPGGKLDIGPGDTLTVPTGLRRRFSNRTKAPVWAFVVRGGDHPRPPEWMEPSKVSGPRR